MTPDALGNGKGLVHNHSSQVVTRERVTAKHTFLDDVRCNSGHKEDEVLREDVREISTRFSYLLMEGNTEKN